VSVAARRVYAENSKVKLAPFGGRIIVRPDDEGVDADALGENVTVVKDEDGEIKTTGGILIPKTAEEKTIQRALTGEVVEAGSETEWVKVGDKVYFGIHAGYQMGSEIAAYKDCLIMSEDDVLAKVVVR